jgi:hypothetical protein
MGGSLRKKKGRGNASGGNDVDRQVAEMHQSDSQVIKVRLLRRRP